MPNAAWWNPDPFMELARSGQHRRGDAGDVMSDLDEREIADIIERVRRRVDAAGGERPGAGLRAEAELSAAATAELGDGIHATIDEAVVAANQAFVAFGAQGLASRKVIIDAVRRTMLDHAEQLARMAHQETHIGRLEDKVVKNRLVASKAPGPEDLEVQAVSGDAGMMVTELDRKSTRLNSSHTR